MPSGVALTGRKFGRITVLKETKRTDIYECQCVCGNKLTLWRSQLVNRVVRHCGCLYKRPSHIARNRKQLRHTRNIVRRDGRRRIVATAEYWTWSSMKERCLLPNNLAYENYGGRGVTISDRWLGKDGFRHFLEDLGPRPVGMTLDRIDPFGNYEPLNCKWADIPEQIANRRLNYVEVEDGELKRKDHMTDEEREMYGLEPAFA